MVRRVPLLTAVALAFSLPMVACDVGTDGRTGLVSILLTDAPGDVTEAWVTITDIYLQGEAGEGDPPGGRVYLLEGGEETHELLSLANTVADLVTDAEVPSGTYGQLRIVMSGGCIVTADGSVYASSDGYLECGQRTGALQMPSFAQSGAKVRLNGLTVSGGQHVLLLDFDVSQSFGPGPAGQSGMWVMTPVIHAAEIQLTAGVTATLSAGDVELPEGVTLGDFTATLTPGAGDVSEAPFTESGGVFRAEFRYLIPSNGPFSVVLNAPEDWTVSVSPESPQVVSPASGQTATIEWTLLSLEQDEQ
jgi:hypothetical protein